MEITPEKYIEFRNVNRDHSSKVKELFQDHLLNRSFEVIFDIGCGPGHVTKALTSNIKHNKIIGLDIDPKMISFANLNNKLNSIEYLTQNMTQSWDEINKNIKDFESNVDFIHCKDVLHWIVMKDKFLSNCSKLLTKNGILYTKCIIIPDLYNRVNEEFKSKTNIEWLSIGSQINYFNQLFVENGFKILKTNINYSVKELNAENIDKNSIEAGFEHTFDFKKLHFQCKADESEILLDQFKNYLFDAQIHPEAKQLNCNAFNDFKKALLSGNINYSIMWMEYFCEKM